MTPKAPLEMKRAGDPYVDGWTPVHFLWGTLFGLILSPFWALVLLALWEPFLLIVIAPRIRGAWSFLDERTQLSQPTLRNVLVDLVADVAGVAFGAFVLVAPAVAAV